MPPADEIAPPDAQYRTLPWKDLPKGVSVREYFSVNNEADGPLEDWMIPSAELSHLALREPFKSDMKLRGLIGHYMQLRTQTRMQTDYKGQLVRANESIGEIQRESRRFENEGLYLKSENERLTRYNAEIEQEKTALVRSAERREESYRIIIDQRNESYEERNKIECELAEITENYNILQGIARTMLAILLGILIGAGVYTWQARSFSTPRSQPVKQLGPKFL